MVGRTSRSWSHPLARQAFCLAAVVVLHARFLRPRLLHWGASPAEVKRPLPGDQLIPVPRLLTTMATTVDVPPEDIWPWLVQIGQGRGGFYSYDWLENLCGLNVHSTDRIHPELQNLQVGDIILLDPQATLPMTVVELEPHRALVLRSGRPGEPSPAGDYLKGGIAASWAFVLEPRGPVRTRLLVRLRSDWQPSVVASLANLLVLEPVQFLMGHKMILGMKKRAEASCDGRK